MKIGHIVGFLTISLLIAGGQVVADIDPNAGTSAAPFLKLGLGARPAALSEAYVAIADDAEAVQWNPGGLGWIKYPQVSTTHLEFFQDINFEAINYAHPVRKFGVVGMGFIVMYLPPIPKTILNETRNDVIDIGTFTVRDMALSFSWGKRLTPLLGLGGSFKFVQQRVASEENNGILFDVGALYRSRNQRFSAGVSLLNFGQFELDRAPVALRSGIAYSLLPNKLLLAFAGDFFFDNKPIIGVGAEYHPASALTLRAGYRKKFNSDDSEIFSRFSAGAGFRFRNIWLDYAYVPFGELGESHRVSAKVGFGKPPEEISRPLISDVLTYDLETKQAVTGMFKDIDWEAGRMGILRGNYPGGNRLTYILIPEQERKPVDQDLMRPDLSELADFQKKNVRNTVVGLQKRLDQIVSDPNISGKIDFADQLFVEGRYFDALNIYFDLLKLYPDEYIIKYNIAGIYYSLKMYSEAARWYERAALLNPLDSETFFWLGFSYYNLKNIDMAKVKWAKALSLDPRNNTIKWNLSALQNSRELTEK